MVLGTTYSHRQIQHLKLDPAKSFEALLDFRFDIVRLICYWEEIEVKRGEYDFSKIRVLLERCEKKGQKVLLSIGMKAPRWPEYYFPAWLVDKTPGGATQFVLPFVEKSIMMLRKYSCITHWQIENEPLDPSGPKDLVISPEILAQEVSLLRQIDTRQIVINLWGNELTKRGLLPGVEKEADIIGLDLYYKVPIIGRLYRGPNDADTKLRAIIARSEKPFWITELQAEPWESNFLVSNSLNTPSMNATLLEKNYARVHQMDPEAIFFWGFEYWLWKKAQGDPSLWHAAKKIVEENKREHD